ncbi:MAG: hypothetical protein ACK551_06690 [Vampirovibrionales bacterium]
MRLSPLSFQNTYASAKASPTHSLARTGVTLNPKLRYVYFNTGDINQRFSRFLYGNLGRGPVGRNYKTSQTRSATRSAPAQFRSDLHKAMKLLCQEGLITLTADRGNHGHLVTLNPHTNNPHFPYSIHAMDVELPKVSSDGKRVDLKSNALVNYKGEAFPYPNKPLYEFLIDGVPQPNWGMLGWIQYKNVLSFPMFHISQILQMPRYARIKLDHHKNQFQLDRDQQQLPSSVIEGLNIISELLRPFDPRLSYTRPYHFS